MKTVFQLIMALAFLVPLAHADYTYEQMEILKNDKEPVIQSFSKREKKKIKAKFQDKEQNALLVRLFYSSVQDLLNSGDQLCDLNLVQIFTSKLAKNNLPVDKDSIVDFLKVLRVNNNIDDILYIITTSALKDKLRLADLNVTKRASRFHKASEELLKENDLKDLFGNFDEWPDDKSRCSYQEFYYIKNHVRNKDGKISKKNKDIMALIHEAYNQKLISLETYHRLNYLADDADLEKRDIWLDGYLKIAFLAKNKMIPVKNDYTVKNIEDEDDFSQEKVRRFSKITRRRLLFRKYDETQIILLAQVLQKASRRMGVDPDTKSSVPVITQEFWITNENGERQNLVEKLELDPQSQYNLARRRMRKDIVDLQMMDIFTKVKITHEDVVVAALETGYISLDDIEYVVKYDDLWNPEISTFERVTGFIFTVTGYTTFFLPPPWNVAASIALGVVEGLVESKHANGADNDNPATFIE